jgi:hypothetical protein
MTNSPSPENRWREPNEPPTFFRERLMRLSQAARCLPALRKGKSGASVEKPPHPSTLVRWWKTGLKSRSGKTVHLFVQKVGGANCTSLESLVRFFESLDDLKTESSQPSNCAEATLQQQTEVALKILQQRGLLK